MGIITFGPRQQALVGHLIDYPSVAHDDQADSLAGVVQMVADTGRLQCQ
jgi:phage terminase large subunit-like protein